MTGIPALLHIVVAADQSSLQGAIAAHEAFVRNEAPPPQTPPGLWTKGAARTLPLTDGSAGALVDLSMIASGARYLAIFVIEQRDGEIQSLAPLATLPVESANEEVNHVVCGMKWPFDVYEDYEGGYHIIDATTRIVLTDDFAYDLPPDIDEPAKRKELALARMAEICRALNRQLGPIVVTP